MKILLLIASFVGTAVIAQPSLLLEKVISPGYVPAQFAQVEVCSVYIDRVEKKLVSYGVGATFIEERIIKIEDSMTNLYQALDKAFHGEIESKPMPSDIPTVAYYVFDPRTGGRKSLGLATHDLKNWFSLNTSREAQSLRIILDYLCK